MASSDLLTTEQAADELCVSQRMVRLYIQRGVLEAIHRGLPDARRKTWAVTRQSVDALKRDRSGAGGGPSHSPSVEVAAA